MPRSRVVPAALALVFALISAAACSESVPKPLTTAKVAGLDARPSNKTCLAPSNPGGRILLEKAYGPFARPLMMVERRERGLIYVAEMQGRVKAIDTATGNVSTVLDLVGKVGTFFDQGLLGLAIHPTKPYAYLTVERDADATTLPDLPNRAEIIRFDISADGRTFDPATEKLILRIDRPTNDHYPGNLIFGSDGYLYIGVGDGGMYADIPANTKYDPNLLLGSILRIDVDGGDPYAIPKDNPFVAGGARPEIWAEGFRNPWRFSFDRNTGEMWGGDVGQGTIEEIDKIEKGKNYGWPVMEGNICFKPPTGCDPTGLEPPAYVYPHTEGTSVTGGYVYRGSALPDLVGKYIFGDYTVGRIYSLEGTPGQMKATLLNTGGRKPSISAFFEDADGELYAIDWETGNIYKLISGDTSDDDVPGLPALLSQTGCVDPQNPKVPAAGLLPYDVTVQLWSDGAEKTRFIGVPDDAQIHVEDDGDFSLPAGSVVMKTFAMGGKNVETRLLFHHPTGDWSGASYEWNDDQTDATLLTSGKDKIYPDGHIWTFPSPSQCFVCHKDASHITIGIETLQMNRDFGYAPDRRANQLATLSSIGYLDKPIDPFAAPRLPELDGIAPVADRARAYLHANCSMCHRKDAGTGVRMDMRYGMPLSALEGCASSSFAGSVDAHILTPGDPQNSGIYRRMTSRGDGYGMPPLATWKVDELAAPIIESWIRDLKTCE